MEISRELKAKMTGILVDKLKYADCNTCSHNNEDDFIEFCSHCDFDLWELSNLKALRVVEDLLEVIDVY